MVSVWNVSGLGNSFSFSVLKNGMGGMADGFSSEMLGQGGEWFSKSKEKQFHYFGMMDME
ncbi:hypothetical protein [Vandammella animalimorsus]|uniref:hypothetical protein n=1 Tax=Vandammella animalimorsus TaxID=2029117 RepID=UPI001551B613|nr:hypothetical protein [Vandammella animalimorsus]